jgi:hypothetical protein
MRVKGEGNVKKGRKHDSKMRHKGCGEAVHRDWELGELASVSEAVGSLTGDERIRDDEVWEDAVSQRSSDR